MDVDDPRHDADWYAAKVPDLEQRPHACTVCGATPIASLRFRKVTGRLHRWEIEPVEGVWCRDCALHHGRNAQAHTMIQGWLGIVAIPLTIVYGSVNAARLSTANRIGSARRPKTLEPGRPVFFRLGMITTIIALAILSFIPVDWLRVRDNPLAELTVGECVDLPTIPWISEPKPTDCLEANDGVVIGLGDYPGKGAFGSGNEARAFVDASCQERFDAFLNSGNDGDAWELTVLTPPRGPADRTYACIATHR